MTSGKMTEVLDGYIKMFADLGISEISDYTNVGSKSERLQYLYAMCKKTKKLVEDGDVEKANRWLGFIQGSLWVDKVFTIDDMRDHNRSS
ncbi:MAG: hypothetical protein Q7S53_04300 [bacterium]|nr:hypothetical protein [bacterium]